MLITGGAGFVGSHLARRLASDGCHVHVITRPQSRLDLIADLKDKVVCHVYGRESSGLPEIVKAAQPDVVFHLASYFKAEHRPEEICEMLDSNLIFGTQLLDAMANAGVRSLVNAGTAWQHYQGREYSPTCLYAASKQAFEALIQFYVEAHGISAVTLKLTDTYGPDDPRPKLFNLIRKAASEGTALDMSPGEQKVDFVHVDDVVRALWAAAESLLGGASAGHVKYWLSGAEPRRLRDVVEEFIRNEKLDVVVHWGNKGYRRREMMELARAHPVIPR